MAESKERRETVSTDFGSAYSRLQAFKEWKLLFQNQGKDEAELVFLTGMFSGAGLLGLFSHGARKSLVFVKLFRRGSQTEVVAIAGGTETWTGFDFGRHEANVNKAFKIITG